jgi:peptidoglycan/xylan/chitin deacetylase (PgdA/CDA1 family)
VPADLVPADERSEPTLGRIDPRAVPTYDRGGIVRGPRSEKRLALVFTGGSFADGGPRILDDLKARGAGASFFLTGDFCRYAAFRPIITRMRDEGHYVGAHSDKHLLYASWDSPPKLLVTRAEFDADLTRNLVELEKLGIPQPRARVFLPPSEHYTQENADWSTARGLVLIGFTPGTRSSADYLPDNDPNFISAPEIVKTILKKEATDRDGLNGFLLLMHVGATPERTRDRLHDYLGALLDELGRRGYRFVRVDELLELPPSI